MRSPKLMLIVAGILIVLGLAIALIDTPGETTFGYFGEALPSSFFLVTPRSALGYLISVFGALLGAGAIGFQLGRRSQ